MKFLHVQMKEMAIKVPSSFGCHYKIATIFCRENISNQAMGFDFVMYT